MKPNEIDIALFDQYHQGELSSEEMVRFQSRLSEDEQFHEDYALYQQALLGVESMAAGEEMKKIIIKQRRSVKKIWIPLSVAASHIFVFTFYFLQPSPIDTQNLFETYYQTYPSLGGIRSIDSDGLNQGLNDYEAGNYESAILNFGQSPNDTLRFYKAISHLSLGQMDSALISLKSIPDTSILTQEVVWYSAITYLKQEKVEEALQTLRRIKPSEYKSNEAEQLIQVLR